MPTFLPPPMPVDTPLTPPNTDRLEACVAVGSACACAACKHPKVPTRPTTTPTRPAAQPLVLRICKRDPFLARSDSNPMETRPLRAGAESTACTFWSALYHVWDDLRSHPNA